MDKKVIRRTSNDKELVAINKVSQAIDALDSGAKLRVLGFVNQREYDRHQQALMGSGPATSNSIAQTLLRQARIAEAKRYEGGDCETNSVGCGPVTDAPATTSSTSAN